jgi:hypothetical protein
MGARIDETITVELNETRSKILSFSWRGQPHPVQKLGRPWMEPRRWWRGEGERTWFQVNSQDCVYELYLDHTTKSWYLGFVRG